MESKGLTVRLEVHQPRWMFPVLKAYCVLLWVGLQMGLTTADRMNDRLGKAIHSLVYRNIRVSKPRLV